MNKITGGMSHIGKYTRRSTLALNATQVSKCRILNPERRGHVVRLYLTLEKESLADSIIDTYIKNNLVILTLKTRI